MARIGRLAGVDIDALFNALRPRIVGLLSGYSPGGGGTGPGLPGAQGPPGPKGIVWRGEWSAATNYDVGDIVYLGTEGESILTFLCLTAQTSLPGTAPTVGGDENWWEISPGYLIIDGSRAMTGDLNMDTHEVDNILNANFSGDVGDAEANNVRQLHLIGDDDDGEARIDGAERIVFNEEPTKSVIENPSRIELNPNVAAGEDYTAGVGKVSWDSLEDVVVAYVASGGGVVLIALGWAASIGVNGAA